jgi:hypothetical protein
MKIKILTLFALFAMTGCVQNTLVLDKQEKEKLTGKTITAIYQKNSYPYIKTPMHDIGFYAVGGVVGGVLMSSANKQINTLTIPANYISEDIIAFLEKKYKMVRKEKSAIENLSPHKDHLDILSKEKELSWLEKLEEDYSSDYILDIHDTIWAVSYRMDWKFHITYHYSLETDMQLIERESKKIVSQTSCQYSPKDDDKLPTYDEFFGNDAKLFKDENIKASDLCIKKIKSELFVD